MTDLYIFMNTLRDLTRPRKLLAVLVLIVFPTALALLLHAKSPHDAAGLKLYNMVAAFLVYNFVLVILSVIFGTSVITQEVEQKTIVYLLTRPVPRWRILLMKYAAAVTMTLLTALLASLLLARAVLGNDCLHNAVVQRDLSMLVVGAMAYGGLFLLVATMVDRPLMFGLLYAFGWESWVPSLPGNFKYLSLMAYLRTLAPHGHTLENGADSTPLLAVINLDPIPVHTATLALTIAIVVTLVGALVVFSTREYVPREEAA